MNYVLNLGKTRAEIDQQFRERQEAEESEEFKEFQKAGLVAEE